MPTKDKRAVPNAAPRFLFLLTNVFWFTQYTFTSYLNPEMERMGASATLMGLCGTMYGLFQLLARVPFGLLSARAGRQKPFVVLGCAFSLLACVGMYLFYTPISFLIFRAVAGVASASWVCFTVMYGGYFSREDSPRHISLLDMGGQLGKLICFLLLVSVVARYDCRAALVVGIISGLIALLMSTNLKEKPLKKQRLRLSDIKRLAGSRHLLLCAALAALAQFIHCGTCTSFTQNLATRMAADNAQLTWLNVALLVPTVLWGLVANKLLVPRIGAKKTILAGFVMALLYTVLAPLCKTVTALYLCQILAAGSTSAALAVLLGQSMRDVSLAHRSLAMTLFQILFSAGIMLGPLFMGVVADAAGLNAAFFAMSGVALLACGLTALLYKDQAADEKHLV